MPPRLFLSILSPHDSLNILLLIPPMYLLLSFLPTFPQLLFLLSASVFLIHLGLDASCCHFQLLISQRGHLPPVGQAGVCWDLWLWREHVCHYPGLRGEPVFWDKELYSKKYMTITLTRSLNKGHQQERSSRIYNWKQLYQRPWQLASSTPMKAITVVYSFGAAPMDGEMTFPLLVGVYTYWKVGLPKSLKCL